MSSFNDNNALLARPEDVFHACVAYNRPEMLALDSIIRLRSSDALVVSTAKQGATLASLPAEIFLRIRSHLQSSLRSTVAEHTVVALREYQAALVEGICPDCYWWNVDIYGEDVWAWVENGYRGACSCVVSGDVDPRVPSPSKSRVLSTFEGLEIPSRAHWFRAHVSRTHLRSASSWRFARDVLAEFGCTPRITAPQAAEPPQSDFDAFKKATKRTLPCDFGALISIAPTEQRSAAEEPAITLRRLTRELGISSCTADEPSIALESSSAQYVDMVYKRNACETHFRSQRSAACNCIDCLRTIFAVPSSLATYALAKSGSPSRFSRLFTNSTAATGLLCAVGAVYLVARVASQSY
ncbi:hypothetical protein M0805_000920 [Coniferiporia weirii]|nr:hypothetical protein M0805_000920 [Coniferiporia weirii]